MGTLNSKPLSGKLILSQHIRLASTQAILSRAFTEEIFKSHKNNHKETAIQKLNEIKSKKRLLLLELQELKNG